MEERPKRGLRSNQGIRASRIRLIDEAGNMIGVVSLKEALDVARQKELDLVEISPDADPPVCKIVDYGRMRYKEQKKKTEMRKKQKLVVIKEIQLRPNIQEHDYQVKLGHAERFLKHGDKVRLSLQFRGREIAFVETSKKLIDRMIEDLIDLGKPEFLPKLEGRRLLAVLTPSKG